MNDARPRTEVTITTSVSRIINPVVAFALVVVYVVWGTTFYAIRVALHGYPAFVLCGIRFVLAGGLLFAYTLAIGAVHINRRLLFDALLTGALMVTLGNGLVVVAEQRVSSGIAALVISTESIFVLLVSLASGRRSSTWQIAGIALCFAGIVALASGAELRYSSFALMALLTASLAWAIGSIWSSRRVTSGDTLVLVALQMLVGGGISLVIAWLSGERLVVSSVVSANLALLYLALFGSIAAFVSYNYLLRMVSPSLATSYAYVNPAIAFAVGCVFDRDVLRFSTALSLLGVLAGVWLIVRHETNTVLTPSPVDG